MVNTTANARRSVVLSPATFPLRGKIVDIVGKRVLVTGSSGFIGSHLVQALLAEGATVRAMTHYRGDPSLHNLEYLSRDELASIELIKGNVEDPYFVRRAVAGCDVVFHLAALIAIPYSYLAPASYVASNVQGTVNVLEACRAEETPRLVHTSTSECYGSARYTPIDELHPLQGQSPYSASKIAADKMVESYFNSFELPAVTIRPFNTFGPRQSARAVIPTIIGQLLSDTDTLELGSLTPLRDLTYVSDTVSGFLAGAQAVNVEGEVFNLGTGEAMSIGDIAHLLMKLVGREVPISDAPERVRPAKSEVTALVSDNSKAREKLGWAPSLSLEDGLRATIEFFRENPVPSSPLSYGL